MGAFSFAGKTIVRPGILVDTEIGANLVFQFLPFGTLAMFGAADGGAGNGTVYTFDDPRVLKQRLRSGPLVDALSRAATIGGSNGLIAVVCGTKTPGTLALTGAAGANQPTATATAGDQGAWTNAITIQIIVGTAPNTVAALFSYPDAISGRTLFVGGLGTKYDNLTLYSQLAALVASDSLLTPAASTGYAPVVSITVTKDGLPGLMATTPLAGGTGGGSQPLVFADYKAGIDAAIATPFDIGHLVGAYDTATQVYADAQAQQVAGYGRLRRFIHQARPTGVALAQNKVQNSLAIVSGGLANVGALNSSRSSVVAQQGRYLDPNTGATGLVDVAPLICGLAALKGATGDWGPATPLTYETIPGLSGVDYPVLDATGDTDAACGGGLIVLEQVGNGAATTVRVVQSVTTAPNDPTGKPWVFAEFSVVRVSDVVLANVKATVESNKPKAIGGGNTRATMQSVLADVRDVLEDALENQWIDQFDPNSITIYTTGSTGTDDICKYSMAPTLPFNHLGIGQTLLPYATSVSLGDQTTVNG